MKREEMFKSIMQSWYCANEEFIEFREKKDHIIVACGCFETHGNGFDFICLDCAKSYEELFENILWTSVYDYLNDYGDEDYRNGFCYFDEEQYDFLKKEFGIEHQKNEKKNSVIAQLKEISSTLYSLADGEDNIENSLRISVDQCIEEMENL